MVVSERDYLAFGAVMHKRSYENEDYTYSFNGKELDKSTGWQDYGFRDYNPVYKRFDSVDPLTQKYPELTPYQFASNTPIMAIDLDGLEKYEVIETASNKSEIRLLSAEGEASIIIRDIDGKVIEESLLSKTDYSYYKEKIALTRIIEVKNEKGEEISILQPIKGWRNDKNWAFLVGRQVIGERTTTNTVNILSHLIYLYNEPIGSVEQEDFQIEGQFYGAVSLLKNEKAEQLDIFIKNPKDKEKITTLLKKEDVDISKINFVERIVGVDGKKLNAEELRDIAVQAVKNEERTQTIVTSEIYE